MYFLGSVVHSAKVLVNSQKRFFAVSKRGIWRQPQALAAYPREVIFFSTVDTTEEKRRGGSNCPLQLSVVSKRRFSSESEAGSSGTSETSSSTVSSKEWKSTAKRWFERLLYVAGAITTIGGAYTYLKYPFRDYKRIKNTPSVKEHYVPRVKEMEIIEAEFSDVEKRWRKANPQDKGSLARLYLPGKPGRGKTQLALGYAQKFYKDRRFPRYMFSRVAVIHLDASSLTKSYSEVLELLSPGVNTTKMTLEQMSTKVNEELKKIDRWLLVVDNFNSRNKVSCIPKVVDRDVGRILLVTTNPSVLTTDFSAKHKVEEMTEQEAVRLLKKTSGHDGKRDEAEALVNFLGRVPLSIASAGHYVKLKRSNDPSYSFGVHVYQKQHGEVSDSDSADESALEADVIDKRMYQSVHDAVMATKEDVTFRKVFTLLACCGDSPVPMTLIARLLGISPHEDILYLPLVKVRECLLLDCHCPTTTSNKSEDARIQKETITVDSVTRSVLREEMFKDPNFLSSLQEIRKAFIEVGLDEEKKDTNEWYEIRRKLISHMESVQEVADATEGYKEDPQQSCDYEYVVGKCYANSIPEELGKAEQHLTNARKRCPEQSERLGDIYYELHNIKRRQGLTEESMKFYQLGLNTGKDKKKKLRVAEGLCKTLNHRGEFDKVKKISQDLVGSYRDEELVTLHTQLGVALVWLGEGEEAEKYLKKALDHSNKRQKLRPMTSLVRVYHLMGKYKESLDLLNEMQQLYQETDKPESGGLAIVEGRRSAVHHFLKNRAESIKHAKETLKRVKAMQESDPKNIGIAIALICLGPVYCKLDEASLEEAKKALETTKDNIGEPYFQYTRMVAQLGKVKQLRHKPEEAKEILEELRKQTKLPHDHIGCRDLFDNLGQVYYELGMYKESLKAFESCKKIVDHYYRHYPQHRDIEYVRVKISEAQAKNA